VPRAIRFVEELPRTASGKLQRWLVRQEWDRAANRSMGDYGTWDETE